MMNQERSQAAAVDYEVDSHDLPDRIVRPSMIYTILPAVVQNRIPTLPSIRRSISDIRGRPLHVKREPSVSRISPPETPPPGYSERPGSAQSNRSSFISTDTDITFRDDASTRPESSTSMSTPPPFAISETETGINWKYANQGISLANQAYQESHTLARKADSTSTTLTRQLYIHGLTYLLRGLPTDLSPEETLSLQASVPQSIVNVQNDPSTHALIPFGQDKASQGPPQDAGMLHRVTAMVVFQTFLMIQFLLPYIRLFVGHAYRFERDHKVTQRLLSTSLTTADELRRRGLQLSHTICQMNDGKVGQAINDLMVWWVRGVTGGLQQGITEGVSMFGVERPASPKSRVEKAD